MIAEQGIIYSCRVDDRADMNRQIVKSESASIRFPDIDFEIPTNTQRGLLNTIEGFLMKAREDLTQDQPQRLQVDYQLWQAVQQTIEKLDHLLE
jgi:zinc finger protein